MAKTPQDVLRQIKDEGIELIDLKFTDLHGKWQHLTSAPISLRKVLYGRIGLRRLLDPRLERHPGLDMAMVPDASTAWVDPFYRHKTLSMICSIQEPRTGLPYERCPRALAPALDYLSSTGLADMAFFGLSLNSSSSTTSATTRRRVDPFTALTPSRRAGTPAVSRKVATSLTKFRRRRGTSPLLPTTQLRTSVPRCFC